MLPKIESTRNVIALDVTVYPHYLPVAVIITNLSLLRHSIS